jgi:hypothetical protein
MTPMPVWTTESKGGRGRPVAALTSPAAFTPEVRA